MWEALKGAKKVQYLERDWVAVLVENDAVAVRPFQEYWERRVTALFNVSGYHDFTYKGTSLGTMQTILKFPHDTKTLSNFQVGDTPSLHQKFH